MMTFTKKITPTYIKERHNIKDAILNDSEIITISIVGELLLIDSEKAWLEFCIKIQKTYFQNSAVELYLTEPAGLYTQ
ncbi:hypothetical protein [Tissierella pigra]|uniref:hypothetical protein n=1 Tax=Tissierella pigra TaxID=2607614 RepID=UPI00398E93A6